MLIVLHLSIFQPRIKSKKDKNGSDNGDPLITAWGCGESDRGAGMDAAGGLPCCLPKSLPNTMCLCQPTTNNNQKEKKKNPTTKQQTVSYPDLKTTTAPYIRPLKISHAQSASQTPTLRLT